MRRRSRPTIHLVDRFRRKVVERTGALITGRKPHEPWPEGPTEEAHRNKAPGDRADRDRTPHEQAEATRRTMARRFQRYLR